MPFRILVTRKDIQTLSTSFQHCFLCRPSDFNVSEDAPIEPKTVATLALLGYKKLVVHYFRQADDFHRFFLNELVPRPVDISLP